MKSLKKSKRSPNWGGPRPGAGRKTDAERETVAIRVKLETIARLRTQALRRKISVNKLIAEIVENDNGSTQ
jgi:predicted DNA-binding ribbon-helix-helix protein